ncbi:hypothetical protein L6164_010919 [Bauhinia variegata]|uniref:Uncharacterized protein n=1 Tax=Bauhinia variegata TaxID=167791 RepID=A0ACB9P471_BAUVA|nr:hypothetical protein L6164_010919 [Bauhinia variegata]
MFLSFSQNYWLFSKLTFQVLGQFKASLSPHPPSLKFFLPSFSIPGSSTMDFGWQDLANFYKHGSINRAKILAIQFGFSLALDLNVTNIDVESDSLSTVLLLKNVLTGS